MVVSECNGTDHGGQRVGNVLGLNVVNSLFDVSFGIELTNRQQGDLLGCLVLLLVKSLCVLFGEFEKRLWKRGRERMRHTTFD